MDAQITAQQKAEIKALTVRGATLPWGCGMQGCNYQCKRANDVRRHIITCHWNLKFFQCTHEDCDKSYLTQSALNTHLDTHTGTKKHACRECGRQFTDQSSRNRHEKHVHKAPSRRQERPAKKVAARKARAQAPPTPASDKASPIIIDDSSHPVDTTAPADTSAATIYPSPPETFYDYLGNQAAAEADLLFNWGYTGGEQDFSGLTDAEFLDMDMGIFLQTVLPPAAGEETGVVGAANEVALGGTAGFDAMSIDPQLEDFLNMEMVM